MHKEIELAGHIVGISHSPVVFVEIGINHGGSLEVAKEMARRALEAGGRFIKHQTHIPEAEMSKEAEGVYPGNSSDSIFKVISDCTLSKDEEKELAEFVQSLGGIFFSTPFSREAVDRLEEFEVPFYKIGSGECNNYPLVDYVASTGKPVVLSTGMNSIETVRQAVDILESRGTRFALLHTTNLYPTPSKLLRLGGMTELLEAFQVPVGLSDHSTSNAACVAAVGLGASILERHFVDTKERKGPDVICSMDPLELEQLLDWSSQVHLARGGRKALAEEEQVTANFAFSSVSSLTEIAPGEILTRENIFPIRPGNGQFSSNHYERLLGRIAKERIPKRTQLRREMLESYPDDNEN